MGLYYILVNRDVVPIPDVSTWGHWMQTAGDARIVAQDRLSDDVLVSTVFLGLDHGFCNQSPPILFETMVFGGPLHEECVRYCTYADAERGHTEMLIRVTEAVTS